MKRERRILFLLKERFYGSSSLSYGLINSATYVAEFLDDHFFNCKIETVIDSNHIEKAVHEFRPDIVIIEALWVTGSKLKELMSIRRHRHIHWIVRIHSDIGFLSSETMGIKNINDYIELYNHDLKIAVNSKQFQTYLSTALNFKIDYLPNIVNVIRRDPDRRNPDQDYHYRMDIMTVGCFGALRLLKNHCFQALCAIGAGELLNKVVHFHITRDVGTPRGENSVLRNLKEIFSKTTHELIVHDWMPNDEFQKLIRKMDIGLQLSYTESFNIVSAEFVNNNKLIVVSDSIDWMPELMKTSTVNYNKATEKILAVYNHRHDPILKITAKKALKDFNAESERIWLNFLD